MASEEHVFRGDVESTPLPKMLATIHRHGVPGVVECSRNDELKKVFFFDGDVIFATSSDREESLGEYLLMKGRISRAQYDVAAKELERYPDRRLGAVLIQMGFLGAHEVAVAIREQVQQIVWSLFNWEHGVTAFKVGRFRDHEVHQITIPTPRVILSGCKRIADAKTVTARLGGRNVVLERREWPEHLTGFQLERGERSLLDLIDGRTTLFELCEKGPLSPGINARIIYGLSELEVVGRIGMEKSGGIKIQLRSDPG